MSNVVQPVSIVDTDVPLTTVTSSQLLATPFTAGPLVAPAINTVLADTGAQTAGNYLLKILIEVFDTAAGNTETALQRRNAANAANIWEQEFYGCGTVNGMLPNHINLDLRVTLDANERIRVINTLAAGAGGRYHASIWLLPS